MAEIFFWTVLLLLEKEGGAMKVVGVIPARYASSRFPGKPLADIHGKPMIWWVYQQALKVPELNEVIVATDDQRIQTVCQSLSLQVLMTSDKHPSGVDRISEVAALVSSNIYVNIQGDEPLIRPEAISQVIGALRDTVVYATLKYKLTDRKEAESHNTVKIVVDENNDAMYCSRSMIPHSDISLNNTYRLMGLYAYRRDFLIEFGKMPQSKLEIAEGGVEPLRVMEKGYKLRALDTRYTSIGVDTTRDLQRVIEILRQ
ncbi:MAG: 3-deoxy-manno-octulosonate cytidylyltransferase [Treponema sp.]|jgi:3-deoxy-manno-octulosonate cytidylyltransferase (CMP-KDO synthetase)|nr:3-deoxy-manno-octulosonate cytidylyltransferase [Treponema sp.]